MSKNSLIRIIFSAYFLLSYQLLWADEPGSLVNYWQCTTHDVDNKLWTNQGSYQLTAINYSFAACKKESAHPKTCKTSKKSCEQFINGKTMRPMWRCIAIDRMARIWPSNLYDTAEDAALAANAFCKDKSSIPRTCSINMITCRNLNQNTMVW